MPDFSFAVSRSALRAGRVRFIASLAALAMSILFAASAAQAATITVNNNGNGSGTASNCDPGNANTCTLRDAIARAVGGDTIVFSLASPNTTIVLSSELLFSYTANTNPITVDGGGTITLDGNNATRVMRTNPSTVTILRGLTITRGNADFGAGISNRGTLTLLRSTVSNNAASQGGGINNEFGAILTVAQTTLSGNSSTSASGAGAVANDGTATITQSTLSSNTASAVASTGGAITNFPNGSMTITESTLANNTASAYGGGIHNGGTLTVRHVSFVGNVAQFAGGLRNVVGTAMVQRSLFRGNQSTNTASAGYGGAMRQDGGTINGNSNLFWQNVDGGGGFACYQCTSNANAISADPLLGPLQNNGGFTITYLPGAGSAAIDAANCDPLETIDQRGLPRPEGAQCDVGAVEVPVCNLDLIGDAAVRGTSDALLALRLRLGVPGTDALNGIAAASEWPVT